MNKEVHKDLPPFEGKKILVPMDYRMISLIKEILNFSKSMERYRYAKDRDPVRTAGRLMWILNQFTPVIGKDNPVECLDCTQEFHETCHNNPEDEIRRVFGIKGRSCWCKCNKFAEFYQDEEKK